MSEIIPRLFDTDAYLAPETRIPYRLGFRPGEFDDNRTQFVSITTFQGHLYQTSEKNQEHQSLEYAADSPNFHPDFHYWQPMYGVKEQTYTGYVGGCPIISMPDGRTELAIHLWSNNSSVLDNSYAIPISTIKSLHRYSAFKLALSIDADELGMGDVESCFEIEVRHVRTGETQIRQALTEDIEHLLKIQDKLEEPELIYPLSDQDCSFRSELQQQMYGRAIVNIVSEYL